MRYIASNMRAPVSKSPVAKAPKSRMTPAEQSAAFIEAARQLGCDEDPERFKEIVRKLAKAPPAPRSSKPKR